jgi:ATP-dependent RNA helicase RhlE
MSFNDLQLADPLLRALREEGYETPTPIQSMAIPEALAGRDVFGSAQTGTGKTCAFALPILHRLATDADDRRGRSPKALILCPTRELANQIHERLVTYGRHLPLKHVVVYGGVPQGRQVSGLRAGSDVLVATPGRLIDLVAQGHADLRAVETLVLDEADRMLDMGFIVDIRRIIDLIPAKRQTMFFSATVSRDIRKLAASILDDPVQIDTAPESSTVESIRQQVYMIERKQRHLLLRMLLLKKGVGRTLVFTRTKYGADKLAKVLWRSGIGADAIHGNKSQRARFRAMEAFRSGEKLVLVATDIASRGIDVDDITHVVNFDMPIDTETYVHRIGRTARAGASGVAISFCGRKDKELLKSIQRRTGANLTLIHDLPELDESEEVADVPEHLRRTSSPKTIARERTKDADRPRGSKRPAKPKQKSGRTTPAKRKKVDGNWVSVHEDDAKTSRSKPKVKKKVKKRSDRDAGGSEDKAPRQKKKGKGAAKRARKKASMKSERRRDESEVDSGRPRKKKKNSAKMGKAKWKAKAATAGRKGKAGGAQKRKKNTSATPGHRGSPGYSKKSAGRKSKPT